jgi:hypothetical protein
LPGQRFDQAAVMLGDCPEKVEEFSTVNVGARQGSGGAMEIARVPIPPIPDHLKAVIEEQKS